MIDRVFERLNNQFIINEFNCWNVNDFNSNSDRVLRKSSTCSDKDDFGTPVCFSIDRKLNFVGGFIIISSRILDDVAVDDDEEEEEDVDELAAPTAAARTAAWVIGDSDEVDEEDETDEDGFDVDDRIKLMENGKCNWFDKRNNIACFIWLAS